MHYLCLIYVLRSSNYLSNVPPCVKTWKLSAAAHGTRRRTHQWTGSHWGSWLTVTIKSHLAQTALAGASFSGTLRQVMQQGSTSSGDGRRRRRRRRHRHNRFSSIIKVVLPHLTCKAGLYFSFFFCGGHRRCLNTSFSHFFFSLFCPLQPGRIMNNSLGPNTLTP